MSYAYKKIKLANGKTKDEHRLVMETLLGRALLPSEHVHHIDGNKRNNATSNLELLTCSEHAKSHMTGIHKTDAAKAKASKSLSGKYVGDNSATHKLSEAQVIEIKKALASRTSKHHEIASRFGVDRRTVSGINIGRIWKHVKL